MIYRFYLHHDLEFQWLGIEDTPANALIVTGIAYIIGVIAGFMGTGGQQRLADYYIQVHLFFLKGEKGSELDNSKRQQEIYDQMDESTPAYECILYGRLLAWDCFISMLNVVTKPSVASWLISYN